MNTKFFDIFVAKEYETRQNGQVEKKTAWNKVGRAWPAKSSNALSFELFLVPNQRYVIVMKDQQQDVAAPSEEVPF
jgi:hypothetical protein